MRFVFEAQTANDLMRSSYSPLHKCLGLRGVGLPDHVTRSPAKWDVEQGFSSITAGIGSTSASSEIDVGLWLRVVATAEIMVTAAELEPEEEFDKMGGARRVQAARGAFGLPMVPSHFVAFL